MSNPHIDRLLSAVNECDASDLHLVAGVPPAFRVNGELILANEDALREEDLGAMAEAILNEQQRNLPVRLAKLTEAKFFSANSRCFANHQSESEVMKMNGQKKTGGELFIVDNNDEAWKGLKYLQDWTEITAIEQPTLREIRLKIEKHIKNTYLKQVQAPVGAVPVLKCWIELN